MNAAAATKAQAGLMCEIKRYGELSMDAEHPLSTMQRAEVIRQAATLDEALLGL